MKWEVRQSKVPVLVKRTSLWKDQTPKHVSKPGDTAEASAGRPTLNWRVGKGVPEENIVVRG